MDRVTLISLLWKSISTHRRKRGFKSRRGRQLFQQLTLTLISVRYGDPQSKRYRLQRIQWIADVKDGEFEGAE